VQHPPSTSVGGLFFLPIVCMNSLHVEQSASVSESGKIWELYRQKMGDYNYNYIFKKMMKEIEKNLPESKSS
jgi:hypothetical protein